APVLLVDHIRISFESNRFNPQLDLVDAVEHPLSQDDPEVKRTVLATQTSIDNFLTIPERLERTYRNIERPVHKLLQFRGAICACSPREEIRFTSSYPSSQKLKIFYVGSFKELEKPNLSIVNDQEPMATFQLNPLAPTYAKIQNQSRLPSPEPGVFSGDPLQYPVWAKAFETLIESRNTQICSSNSSSTDINKIRVVFDCSVNYKGESLNDYLLQGPDLTNQLVGVLCRFRKDSTAFMCDVEAMFHQFKVVEAHRNFLRFLWWEDGDTSKRPIEYRMTVHLFGAGSSPGCANFGLKRIADDYEVEFGSEAANFVRNDFYVDDGLKSVDTIEHATTLIQQTKEMCAKGGLRLHKFISNSKEVISAISQEDRASTLKNLDLHNDRLPMERALGVYCSIYDPLGLVAPVLLVDHIRIRPNDFGPCSYIHCELVMAKSRVSPLKTITIPRLELTAALIITTSSTYTGPIVRVQQIRDETSPEQWRYVKSKENPADEASRGLTARELLDSKRWLSGPSFLQNPQLNLVDAVEHPLSQDDPEVRRTVLATQTSIDNFLTIPERLEYFSKWHRAKRAIATNLSDRIRQRIQSFFRERDTGNIFEPSCRTRSRRFVPTLTPNHLLTMKSRVLLPLPGKDHHFYLFKSIHFEEFSVQKIQYNGGLILIEAGIKVEMVHHS
ncbi:Hypothetical predicted protein, partial [Paramuricea clavata]